MKKALKTILLFVLVMAMLIPTTVTTFAASLPIQATNEYIVLQKANYVFNSGDDRQVESVKTVYDFAGNTFYVAECTPTGYYIYNVETDTVVESSERGVSPYIGYSQNLYYGGPTYYYVLENGSYKHTIDETETLATAQVQVLRQNCQVGFETIEARYQTRANSVSPMAVYSTDITVDHPEFYQNLTHCGYISGGRCGFIALGMLIAYKDKYADDDLLADAYWETNSILNSQNTSGITVSANNVISKKLYDLDPKDSTTSMHIHNVAKKYFAQVGVSVNHTSRWKPFFTEGTVRNLIDDDNPVILFGSVPDNPTTTSVMNVTPMSSEGDSSNHAVVAYGYSSDKSKFIVHYGWESSYYPDARIDLGYFGLGSIYSFDVN